MGWGGVGAWGLRLDNYPRPITSSSILTALVLYSDLGRRGHFCFYIGLVDIVNEAFWHYTFPILKLIFWFWNLVALSDARNFFFTTEITLFFHIRKSLIFQYCEIEFPIENLHFLLEISSFFILDFFFVSIGIKRSLFWISVSLVNGTRHQDTTLLKLTTSM